MATDAHLATIIENNRMVRYRDLGHHEVEPFLATCPVPIPSGDILEIGCGSGKVVAELAKLYGARAHGVDLADFLKRDISFKVANAEEQLPYADGTFDFAFSFMTFMYLREKLNALREIHRVLKPGASAWVDIQGQMFEPHVYPLLQDLLAQHPNGDQVRLGYWERPHKPLPRLAAHIEKTGAPLSFPPLIRATGIPGRCPVSFYAP